MCICQRTAFKSPFPFHHVSSGKRTQAVRLAPQASLLVEPPHLLRPRTIVFVRPSQLSFGGNRNLSPTHCAEGFARAQSQSGETVHAAEGADWTREAEARSWTSGERSPGKSGSMEEAPHGERARDAWAAGRWDRAALTVPLSPRRLPRSRQRPGGPRSLVPGMPQPEALCVGRRRRSGPG